MGEPGLTSPVLSAFAVLLWVSSFYFDPNQQGQCLVRACHPGLAMDTLHKADSGSQHPAEAVGVSMFWADLSVT